MLPGTFVRNTFFNAIGGRSIRWFIVLVPFFLLVQGMLFGQECRECKSRRVMLYDVGVNIPRPTAPDSIIRWWNYFYLHSGVHSYISNNDPTGDCLTMLDAAMYTKPGSLVNGLEHPTLPPAGEIPGGADYLVYGTVSNSSPPILTVNLETGKSREVVSTYSTAIPDTFDAIGIGKAAGAAIGPLYTRMLAFEKDKRNSGHPYALEPTLTFTPEKSNVSFNEVITVDIEFKDCDDAPLSGRPLQLIVEGGTVNPSSVTTDGDGRAQVQFIAGQQRMIASVIAQYTFTRGTGRQYDADVNTGYIQIDKPASYWYLEGKFSLQDERKGEETTELQYESSAETGGSRMSFAAWIENASPRDGYFTMSPGFKSISYRGKKTEYSYEHIHFETQAGMSDDQSRNDFWATSNTGGHIKLTAAASARNANFGIHDSSADQNGNATSEHLSWDLMNGFQTSSSNTPADPVIAIALNVNIPTKDSVYTTNETTEIPEMGMKEVVTEEITQKCFWDSAACILTYQSNYNDVTTVDMPASSMTSKDSWNRLTRVTALLSHDGNTTDARERPAVIPAKFGMTPNFPNPFNPRTTIRYEVPILSNVRVKIYNVLGQLMQTLADGVQGPGSRTLAWDASGFPSGVYFCRMEATGISDAGRNFIQVNKLVLMK